MATLPVESDNNLETVCLIWLDALANVSTENIATQTQFQSIIHHFKTFETVQDCEQYIQHKTKYDRIFLIVSGRLGQEIVPRIHQFRQVFAIYVYCKDKQRNEEWAKKFTEVKGVIVESDDLLQQIRSDYSKRIQYKVDEPLSISISKLNDLSNQSNNNEFRHSQILIDCFLQMKTISTDKNEFINLCKKEYHSNKSELTIIQEFEQNYSSTQSIWWYTRESFVYRLLNKALCMKNLDLLFPFAFFIRDMEETLEKNKYKTPVQVYHGQIMSVDEFDLLKNSIGQYILMNQFFLTNFNRKQTISFLNEFPVTKNLVRILFEVDADPHQKNCKAFANITSFTHFPTEKQVLFMLGSIFQLKEISYDKQNGLCIIKITLSDLSKEYDATDRLSRGYILHEMGKFDDEEKYFSRLLKEIPNNHEDVYQCYLALGLACLMKSDYDSSVHWYQQSLTILKSTDPRAANSYYSIGCIYQKLNNYQQAMDSYSKAWNNWQENGDNEHIQMAECLNNMGCIYEIEKMYSKALECHKKSLSIRHKFQTDVGASYNNMGNIHLYLGEYEAALENYNNSIEAKRKCLSPQNSSIATTLANMGLVYEKQGKFQQALQYYKKAGVIFEETPSTNVIYKIEIEKDIQRVSSLLKANLTDSGLVTLV